MPNEQPPTVSVPLSEWTAVHREAGLCSGLLMGWLAWDGTDKHLDLLKAVTRKHLDERRPHAE